MAVWRAVLLSGAGMGCGRGAALSYIAMYGAAWCDLLPARHHRPGAGRRRGAVLSSVQRRRAGHHLPGAACPGRSVRRDLSGAVGCFPLLYSYVGRRAVCCRHHRRGARGADRRHHRPGAGRRRGAACPDSSGGGVRSPTGAASSSRHGKAAHGKHPHGKRATKKR